MREHAGAPSPMVSGGCLSPVSLLYSLLPLPLLRSLALTLRRRAQVTLWCCCHKLSKTLGQKWAPQCNLISKPATINTALKFDNKELWQKITRPAVKGEDIFSQVHSLFFLLGLVRWWAYLVERVCWAHPGSGWGGSLPRISL